TKKLEKTKKTFLQMEQLLYATHPDIIFIISPHGSYFSDAFTLNVSPEFETDFTEFGDISTKIKFKGESALAYKIRKATFEYNSPLATTGENKLDHGSSVPLYFLTPHLKNITLLQFGFCDLSSKKHIEFGNILQEVILNSNKRIAVIASGDLSHALTSDSPAGYSPDGKKFDTKIQDLLSQQSISGMLQLTPAFIDSAAECGFRSLLILMGILQGINCSYHQLSYEAPFGVGYLNAYYKI
ncbi:MAG: class III extradiol dioxygenase subunit B-like domain-containing protein, partial [Candidatus Magasanikbacteria bacterium]|nr:class III extradiol dioxygenase subunit B-like domain-containing protein [Candidatus Magasanikbacteria bacterium]